MSLKRYLVFTKPPTMIELVSDQDWKSSDFTLWSQPQGWFKRSIEEQEVGRPTGSIDPSHSTHSNLGDETGLRSVEEEEEVYESQLLWRDEMTGDDDESRWTEGISCLYPNPSLSQESNPLKPSRFIEEIDSESLVLNPPEWYFESRSCTPLARFQARVPGLFDILFHLNDSQPIRTINLKHPRKAQSTASLSEFECMDDSGTTMSVTLWDEAAIELTEVCKPGDIIFLSALSLSTFRDRLQGNTTPATRAQICYRLRPLEASEAVYCPDLRLDFDPTTRRVRELVRWARELFEYDDPRRST